MPNRRDFWARRRFAGLLLVAFALGVLVTAIGLVLDEAVVQAAGAALAATMFPAAIVQLAAEDDDGEDDEGGGSGPDDPDPDLPPLPSPDWDEFDAARRDWDAARVS